MQFPDLQSMFGQGSIIGSQLGLQQFDQAQNGEMLNQAGDLQKMFQSADMHPLKMQGMNLENQTRQAQLPGIETENQLNALKLRKGQATFDSDVKAANSKNNTQISEDEVKSLEAYASKLAMDPDPAKAAQGKQLLAHTKGIIEDYYKEKYRSDRRLAEIGAQGAEARKTDAAAAALGKYTKKGGGVQDLDTALLTGKLNYEKAAILANEMANRATDAEEAAALRARAEIYAQKHLEAKQAGAMVPKAGTPELGALGIQTVAPREPIPLNAPAAASAPASAPAASGPKAPPQPGEVRSGYIFMGGNPADKNNWKKQ